MKYNPLKPADVQALQSIVGPDRCSKGQSNLELHSRDQSHHSASLPEVVLWPLSKSEIAEILKYANERLIPVTPWGAGTSVEGNPIPVHGGIVLDLSMMSRIIEIREADFQADVEPGVVFQDLNEKLRHKGLFFPPDPGARATIGGILANNAGGIRTVKYGASRANVLGLTVVLAHGEILRIGSRSAKTSSGYDLINLFVGSEGTLGVISEATVRLRGVHEDFSTAVATFSSVETAAKAVFEIKRFGLDPAALELLSPECVDLLNREKGLGLAVSPTLFMEFHGTGEAMLRESMTMARDLCNSAGCESFREGLDRADRDRILEARYALSEIIRRIHVGRSHTVIDVAVPVSAYPEMIALARSASQQTGIPGYTFGHAGDGNIHLVFMGKTGDKEEWRKIEAVNEQIVNKAIDMGGTATGEHGIGIGKRKFMAAEHGNSLEWMKKIKKLFDPNGILNPGKIFP